MDKHNKKTREKNSLAEYRRQIDQIDDILLRELNRRFEIVRKVGALKAENLAHSKASIIRPGREASMIRRVVGKSPPYIPKAMLAQLWRLIISTAISIEEETSLSVLATLENKECFWLSREYFGGSMETLQRPTPSEVLQDVISGRSRIGVLPLWDETAQLPWWLRMIQEQEPPRIFARLPFIQSKPSKKSPLVAIGYVEPESSGEDYSLWVINVSERISDHDVETALAKSKLPYTIHSHARLVGSTTMRSYLVEFQEFMEATDPQIKKIVKSILQVALAGMQAEAHYLGAYAKPILFWENTTSSDAKSDAHSGRQSI